jgi:capsular polysaccharide biosynthesis protein
MSPEQHQQATELVGETMPGTLLNGHLSVPGPARSIGLDLNEAVQRILRIHWHLVLVFAVLGLGAGYGLHLGDRPRYSASARVVLDTADAQGVSDSQAYADGARAIVTSPSHVEAALNSIGASRDPATVAGKDVALQSVGTSSVEQVTVTDQDPQVAAQLANALAADLVQTRRELRAGKQAAPIDKQISTVQSDIGQLDGQIKTVTTQLQQAAPADVPRLSGLMTSLVNERQGLVQEEDTLLTLRSPMVVDAATPPSSPISTRRSLDMALGLLLGLVAGIGAAGLVETLRPTVAGARAVGRTVDAPVLGELSGHPGTTPLVLDPLLGLRLRRIAKEASVRIVELATVGPPADLHRLAQQLQMHVSGHPLMRESASGPKEPAPAVRVFGFPNTRSNGAGPSIGLVIITPSVVKRSDLEIATQLALLTDWPLLGVLTYRAGRGRPGTRRRPGKRTPSQGGTDEDAS